MAGEQGEKAGLATRRIDALHPRDRCPRVDRLGDNGGAARGGVCQNIARGHVLGGQDHDLARRVFRQRRCEHCAEHGGGRRRAGSSRIDERDAIARRKLAGLPPRAADLPRDQLMASRCGAPEEVRRLPAPRRQHPAGAQDVCRRTRSAHGGHGHAQYWRAATAPWRRPQQTVVEIDDGNGERSRARLHPMLMSRAGPSAEGYERPAIRELGKQASQRGGIHRAATHLQSSQPDRCVGKPRAALARGRRIGRAEIGLHH
jgi:hypothetical protein